MNLPAARSPHAGYRFPAEIISHTVWLYFRFPLVLRIVEELLAARGIIVSHEGIRQWGAEIRPDIRPSAPPSVMIRVARAASLIVSVVNT
jgi:transposase-like protein